MCHRAVSSAGTMETEGREVRLLTNEVGPQAAGPCEPVERGVERCIWDGRALFVTCFCFATCSMAKKALDNHWMNFDLPDTLIM